MWNPSETIEDLGNWKEWEEMGRNGKQREGAGGSGTKLGEIGRNWKGVFLLEDALFGILPK